MRYANLLDWASLEALRHVADMKLGNVCIVTCGHDYSEKDCFESRPVGVVQIEVAEPELHLERHALSRLLADRILATVNPCAVGM